MDSGRERTSQYISTPQSRHHMPRSMDVSAHDRHLSSGVTTVQNEIRRNSMYPQPYSAYSQSTYQDHRLNPHNLEPSSPMQGVETQCQPYAYEGGRHTQFQPLFQTHSMLPSGQQWSVYSALQQLYTRPTSVLGPLNHQLTVAPDTSSSDQSTICMSGTSTQYSTSQQNPSPYESASIGRAEDHTPFSCGFNDLQHDISIEHGTAHDTGTGQQDRESDFQRYQTQVQSIFEAIITGRLNEASKLLLENSRWLLSSVPQLGLHYDVEAEYESRLSMWRDFNHCWEALAQKQKNVVEEEHRTKCVAPDKLTASKIRSMVTELITLCDKIELHGLVDYEMGVWEDQITSAFITCLDQLEVEDDTRIRSPPI